MKLFELFIPDWPRIMLKKCVCACVCVCVYVYIQVHICFFHTLQNTDFSALIARAVCVN